MILATAEVEVNSTCADAASAEGPASQGEGVVAVEAPLVLAVGVEDAVVLPPAVVALGPPARPARTLAHVLPPAPAAARVLETAAALRSHDSNVSQIARLFILTISRLLC